ncbi:protein ANKUB1-like [Ictalurus furcatus]|uniref:protein ANKUB1-like n=1 Tax=Ictalurus furcatus TaxID=66913 RepID=UPI002350E68E|nr:protein ANKUB1-like [Ictalurus furcatus]
MRIFIAFEESCELFDIAPDDTVAAIKQMVKHHRHVFKFIYLFIYYLPQTPIAFPQACFSVQLYDDKQVKRFLELKFAGAVLQDDWCLTDVGISSGTTICCQLKEVRKAVLHVFSAVTKQTLPIMGTECLLASSVSKLRSLVSLLLGLPISAFTLSTQSGVELYDCNLLSHYAVEAGDTLCLDTWDGWTELLKDSLEGHENKVQCHFSEDEPILRFQKRLALYVAAAHGHLEMATWLLDNGVQAHEPVGVHPSRVWCYETDHPESLKCPVHAAVEAGQLLILKMFLCRNILNLACRDTSNRNLLQIAIEHQHKKCVSHLVSKLYTMVTFRGFALSTWIYVQIKIWVIKAKRGLLKTSVTANSGPFRSRVEDTLLIDGFSLSRMSSVLRGSVFKGCTRVNKSSCGFQALTSQLTGLSCPCHHPAVLSSQNASERLPQLLPLAPNKRRGKKTKGNKGCGRKKPKEILVAENTDHKLDEWSSKVPLPHTVRDTGPRPLFIHSNPKSEKILCSSLESFTRLCGRTPRQNAIYCLATASAFVEKPWLQQLAVAQTLARRSIQKFCKVN